MLDPDARRQHRQAVARLAAALLFVALVLLPTYTQVAALTRSSLATTPLEDPVFTGAAAPRVSLSSRAPLADSPSPSALGTPALPSPSASPSGEPSPSSSGAPSPSASGSVGPTPSPSAEPPSPSPPTGDAVACAPLSATQAALRTSTERCSPEAPSYDGLYAGVGPYGPLQPEGGDTCPAGWQRGGDGDVAAADCSGAELGAAIRDRGGRPSWDAPFRVPGCRLRWFNPEQVCAILTQVGRLMLVGDSLTRHLTQSLMVLATGDYVRGAMEPSADSDCTCESSYRDDFKLCRDTSSAYRASHDLPPQDVCPGWTANRVLFLSEWCCDMDGARLDRAFAEAAFDGMRTVAFVSVGLHLLRPLPDVGPPSTSDQIWERFYAAMWRRLEARMADRRGDGRPGMRDALLVGTTTPPGPNKPAEYLERQGPAVMAAHADALRARQRAAPGSLLFDTHVLMSNTTSYDGTHFPMASNLVAAQALLNVLAAGLPGITVPPDPAGATPRRRLGAGGR